ncbi:Thioredoxin-like [Amycolatopsis marina]|uniref:Thioredoxin-like n=1 Tax=Amycolatopsis marina TaxID=490629 RepID=A0A1I1CJA5_9PSEU|nr:thioredoxin-like domain-containing protein [Amycolatopsis marina]SFB62785.1 Thioredoxin-like [Amycolatopsis marina]
MPHAPTGARAEATPGRRRTLFIALAVVAVLGVAAVLYSAFSGAERPATSAPAGANAGNAAAPAALTARTVDGGQITVPGNRPSVLFFFSVECGSCGPATTALAQAEQAVGDTANFVAVDVAGYETKADVTDFLTAHEATTLAYAIDTDGQWIRTYQVNQLSTVVVLDASGKEVFRAIEPSAEQIQAELATVTA